MKPRYRLAVERDAEQLLELTLRAYEPIRKLGIRFAAAHADLDLVLKIFGKMLATSWKKTGGSSRPSP